MMIPIHVQTRFKLILFLVLIYRMFFSFLSVQADETFKRLTINDGLSHTDANCVVQDSTGLIWIGTNSCLQNFDGYQLQTIDYYSTNPKIFESHNRINAMECSKSKLWIGSDSGLTCVDLNTHQYIPYTIIANDHNILKERINQLSIDNINHRLWLHTGNKLCIARIEESTNTIYILDWENDYDRDLSWGEFTKPSIHNGYIWNITGDYLVQLEINNNKIKIRESHRIQDLIEQKININAIFTTEQYLYLRSPQGCFRFAFTDTYTINIPSKAYINFQTLNPKIPNSTNGTFITKDDKTIWFSYFGGIFKVDQPFTPKENINIYLSNNNNVNFSQARVTSLFIDTYNNLWISTLNKGLYYRSLSPSPFHSISNKKLSNIGYPESEISSVVVQDNTAIWIIVEGGSLVRYDIKNETTERIALTSTRGAADGLQRLALSRDQKRLYIGLSQGVIIYDIETGKDHRLFKKDSGTSDDFSVSVSGIGEDRWGRLWICSWGNGVYCIKKTKSNPSIEYSLTPRTKHSIASRFISDIYIESDAILLCTNHGLNKIWMDNQGEIQNISVYQANNNSEHSISSDYIACITQQNDSTYWFGTIGGGLNKITIHSTKDNDYSATAYTKSNGLTSNDCEIVFIDNEQNVWIGGNGITCFNPPTKEISIYEIADGLQSNSFKIGAGYQSNDGTIYMGSIRGLNYFHPHDFTNNTEFYTKLIFRDLYINGEIIIPQKSYDNNIILSSILNNTTHFKLSHNQNNFIISFSALGYNLSNRIMYRYQMKGYDKEWKTIPYSINKAQYSNLPYGNYQFELQVSTDRGFSWTLPPETLDISILPPWWLTGWAKSLYIIIFILITSIFGYQYNKEQILKREKHIQELQRANDEEKYQSKMRFFMNVSHELKTPLTLIMLAAERMAELNLSKECKSILSNSRKILLLITELVDIRKADLRLEQVTMSHQNITELIRQLYIEMKPWAEKKNIFIEYQSEVELNMDFDVDKMGKLIVNLISNAIKYTPKGGHIKLMLKKGNTKDIHPLYSTMHQEGQITSEKQICILVIQDSGVGISAESIKYIYERFFQVKDNNLTHLGSGIGLAIAKNMVLLHKGSIIVSSERSKGTEFIIALPITNEATTKYPHPAVLDVKDFIDNQYIEYLPSNYEEKEESAFLEHNSETNCPTLLIIEDNKEVLNVLKEHFSPHYNIQVAENGLTGLELCKTLYPDIIISDVMMPGIDGIEMCKRIRNDLSIAYIPIILLTAKGNVESQIEGYESGADIYIPKPFSIKLLDVNVKRLLTQKEKWLKQEQPSLSTLKKTTEDNNQTFEKQLKQLIERNMGDPDFSIDFLCSELCMGRTKLYHKMRQISEQPLADYIRNIRLEKAIYLLKDSDMNINEIMSEVGFVNNSHFSKIFKQKYGISPSDYKKQHTL
ncbi:MAG: response regulator [Bacteroides caccae]